MLELLNCDQGYDRIRRDFLDCLDEYDPRSLLEESTLRDVIRKGALGFRPRSLAQNFGDRLRLAFLECYFRLVLLVDCAARVVFLAVICVVSPVSRISGAVPSPRLAWSRFRSEARPLAAESFELVGTVVPCISSLPFGQKGFRALAHAQVWVEKKAEWISGEKAFVDAIRKSIDRAKERKGLLLSVLSAGHPKGTDWDEWVRERGWVEKSVEFDEIVSAFDTSQRRRICRPHYSPSLIEEGQKKLDEKLCELKGIVTDLIPAAIVRHRATLIRLKRFCGSSEDETIDQNLESLEIFQQFQTEITQRIAELHELHDPQGMLRTAIKDLKRESSLVLAIALKRALQRLDDPDAAAVDFFKQSREVTKQIFELEQAYLYEGIDASHDNIQDRFISHVSAKRDECRQFFLNFWSGEGRFSTRNPRRAALAILGLGESATPERITEAYHTLALAQHPDQVGNQNQFQIIYAAYEFLSVIS